MTQRIVQHSVDFVDKSIQDGVPVLWSKNRPVLPHKN